MKFAELVSGQRPVLVDFHATWCGPCHAQAPILQELASVYGERLRILKIDVDRNPAVAQQYQVQGVPTLILFRDGKPHWRQSGVASLHQLRKVVDQALQAAQAFDGLYGSGMR